MGSVSFNTNLYAGNGLSVRSGRVVLGNDVGGTEAALSSHREIPLNGRNIYFTGTGNILLGTTIDNGEKLQFYNGSISFTDGTYTHRLRTLAGYVFVVEVASALRFINGSGGECNFGVVSAWSQRIFFHNDQAVTDALNFVWYGGISGGFGFQSLGSSGAWTAIEGLHTDVTDATYRFNTLQAGNVAERARFTLGGNLLINTTTDTGERLQVNGDIRVASLRTAEPSLNGAGIWRLGRPAAGAVAMDPANYVEVDIDGTLYRLALAI